MSSSTRTKYAVLPMALSLLATWSVSVESASRYTRPVQLEYSDCTHLSGELVELSRIKFEVLNDLYLKAEDDDKAQVLLPLLLWPEDFNLEGHAVAKAEYENLKGHYDYVQSLAGTKECKFIMQTAAEVNELINVVRATIPGSVDSVAGEYVDNFNQAVKLSQGGDSISGRTTYRYNNADISGKRQDEKLLLRLNSFSIKGHAMLFVVGDGTRLLGNIRMPGYSGRGGVWILYKLGPGGEVLEPKVPAKSDEAPAVLAAPSEDPYFEYYGQAEAEIDAGTYDRNLWAKALIEAEGDEQKRKVVFIQLRARQLYELNN